MYSKSYQKALRPDFSLEDSYSRIVCGLDEAGRGPLAGPVVAACVHIPENKRNLDFVPEIRDSKKLSDKMLEYLFEHISENFICGIAEVSPQEIDEINILQASLKAMEKAFDDYITPSPFRERVDRAARGQGEGIVFALIDGNRIPRNLPCKAQAVVKGDGKSVSIAAASILAKVTRDRIMTRLAAEYPHYGWDRNVGYPTAEHLAAIERFGITPHHRRSFAPVRNFLEFGATQRQSALAG